MNLNNRSSLDPRWTRHHTPVAEGYMLAEIRVIRKNPDDSPTYDQNTESWTGTFTDVFSGAARIQPYGVTADTTVAQDPASRRLVRIQVATVSTGIEVDDMIQVTSCPDNPEMTGYTLEVRGVINSSNAWHTNIIAEANLKV